MNAPVIHPIAMLHARSLPRWHALAIALLDGPHQFRIDGPEGPLGDADKQHLYDACGVLLYPCPSCNQAKAPADYSRDSAGCELCITCYDRAGLENEHSDGHHAGAPDPGCDGCRQAAG